MQQLDTRARDAAAHLSCVICVMCVGPRTCLGKSMAISEASLLLAKLIPAYELTPVPGHVVHYQMNALLPIKDGLYVTAKRRTRAGVV